MSIFVLMTMMTRLTILSLAHVCRVINVAGKIIPLTVEPITIMAESQHPKLIGMLSCSALEYFEPSALDIEDILLGLASTGHFHSGMKIEKFW